MANEEVLFNHFPRLQAALHALVVQGVKKAAFDIQAQAQTRCPVDTGFLKSSIYTITDDGSTYGTGVVPAKPDQHLLPSTDQPPQTDAQAIVAVGAEYGIYVEMGSAHHGAKPYLVPAAEAVRPVFNEFMATIGAKVSALGGEL